MAQITIKGSAYPLVFDMAAWAQIEEEFGLIDELSQRLDSRERVKTAVRLLSILSGGQLSEDLAYTALRPARFSDALHAIWEAIGEGMRTENAEEDEGEVDVVLEEIAKKETGDD